MLTQTKVDPRDAEPLRERFSSDIGFGRARASNDENGHVGHLSAWGSAHGMDGNDWITLDEIDPTDTTFPVAQKAAGEWIVIYKLGEKFRAIGRFCAHQQADLLKVGGLVGNGALLRCNLHGFVYRLESGKCVNAKGEDLAGYEVAVENNRMRVRKVSEGVKAGTAVRRDTAVKKR